MNTYYYNGNSAVFLIVLQTLRLALKTCMMTVMHADACHTSHVTRHTSHVTGYGCCCGMEPRERDSDACVCLVTCDV